MRFILYFLLPTLLIACSKKSDTDTDIGLVPVLPTEELQAAFLIADGVYNSELIAPMDVFHHTVFHTKPAIKVFTISQHKDTITTFEGLRIIPDYAFSVDVIPSIDILIVPSAEHSMDTDLENQELINFVYAHGKKAEYIMSLCDGSFVLAKAGLLNDFDCTTFPSKLLIENPSWAFYKSYGNEYRRHHQRNGNNSSRNFIHRGK